MKTQKNKTAGRMGFTGTGLGHLAIALLALGVSPQYIQAAGGISRIWAVDDGEKVKKIDNNHLLSTSSDNSVRFVIWDLKPMTYDRNERSSEMERKKSKTDSRIGFIGIRLYLFVLALVALIVPPQYAKAEPVTITVNPGESIQDAIDSLPPVGGTVFLYEGKHNISSRITIPSNVNLTGTGYASEIHNIGTGNAIEIKGTYSTYSDIAVQAEAGQKNVIVDSASGFNVGDEVIIEEYHTKHENYLNDAKEINTLASISGKTLIMQNNLKYTYHVKVNSGVRNVNLKKNVTINNLRITGNVSSKTGILTEYLVNSTVENNYLENNGAHGIKLAMFNFNVSVTNNSVIESSNVGIFIKRTKDCTISQNIVKSSLKNIVSEENHDISFLENLLEDSDSNNMELYVGLRYLVKNNVVVNAPAGNGIDFRYTGYSNAIGNTILNEKNGIKVQENSTDNIIKNNIIVNNSASGIIKTSPGSLSISYNDVWNNFANYHGVSPGTGDISADPLFADSSNYDFHLKSTTGRWNGIAWITDAVDSPCIDAGDLSSDYSNEPDPNGERINMGAYGNTNEASKSFVGIGAANAGISRIWAVDDGEKVKKDDLNHPTATSPDNHVWDGSSISLFSAKNEVIAFQLIIEATASGVNNVDVSLDSLTNGAYVIENTGSSNPFDYVGKRIELFTEHYVTVDGAWFPDALIPFAAPKGLGGAPFDIAPKNNQGVWVDIWVPRDALPGIYTGNVEVSMNSVVTHTIPISLQVYDFTLPDECHLKNMFAMGTGILSKRHGVASESPEYYALEAKYHQMAHRHRFDIVRGVKNLGVMDKYHKRYLTGELYTAGNNYEGPGENVGNGTFSIGPYNYSPEEFSPDNEAGWRAGSDAWVNWFNENAPDVEIHKYLRDEPWSHGGIYDDIIERCEWIHNNPGSGSALMTYVTCPIISELQGHCDFWSMSGQGYYLPDAVYEQSQGRKCGFYNGVRPWQGATTIDVDAIDWRVQPWICWRYNVDQYFYWETTHWNHWNEPPVDPFAKSRSNGNGYLFYPGEDVVFPESSRGLPGPLSSIRMKNWRRGMQDYEYLWLARQSGLESEVDAIVKSCIPTALSEADAYGGISWSSHGYGFETFRRQLAYLISGKTGAIRGIVTDKVTGAPVQGARVTDGIREDTTDAAGTYSIDVIAGTRRVTASTTGYEDSAQTGVKVTENDTTTVNFQLARDTVAPAISNAQAQRIASTKATISWNTDEASNSLVRYGTSPGVYTDSVSDSSYVTSHGMSISGLSPDTTYYYVVSGSDQSGNSVTSTECQFKTLMALELVGLWHFDEGSGTTACDASGYGNDGTLVNEPAWVDGKIGKALEFDGVDDSVDCGNPASLDNIVDEITFIAYVKPFKADGCIVQKWEWADWTGYHLDISARRKTLNLIMGYGDKSVLILGTSLAEHLNKFVHIAFTASDSEAIFYVNGQAVSKTIPRKPIHLRNSKDVRIGGGSGWSGKYFNGVIDEVKIYGRALSAEEIREDYEGTPLSDEAK